MKNNPEERIIDWTLVVARLCPHLVFFFLVGSGGFAFSTVPASVTEAEVQLNSSKKCYIVFGRKV